MDLSPLHLHPLRGRKGVSVLSETLQLLCKGYCGPSRPPPHLLALWVDTQGCLDQPRPVKDWLLSRRCSVKWWPQGRQGPDALCSSQGGLLGHTQLLAWGLSRLLSSLQLCRQDSRGLAVRDNPRALAPNVSSSLLGDGGQASTLLGVSTSPA